MTYKFSKGHAMNDQNASVAAKNSKLSRITRGLLTSVGLTAFILVSATAQAASGPATGRSAAFGVLSATRA